MKGEDEVKRSVSSIDPHLSYQNSLARPDFDKMSTTSSKRAKGQKHRDFSITTKQ